MKLLAADGKIRFRVASGGPLLLTVHCGEEDTDELA
jgi:hypothetical protein